MASWRQEVWLVLNCEGTAVARCTVERLMRELAWPGPAARVGTRVPSQAMRVVHESAAWCKTGEGS
jgi:transposase InsO family protein